MSAGPDPTTLAAGDSPAALDPRRPVIRFDMPGVGGSPTPVVPYHLITLPSLLAGLLDQLGYPLADVLGISWVGGLARIMHRLIPRSQLHIYHGGHLELAADSERLAAVVQAFLDSGGDDDDTGC